MTPVVPIAGVTCFVDDVQGLSLEKRELPKLGLCFVDGDPLLPMQRALVAEKLPRKIPVLNLNQLARVYSSRMERYPSLSRCPIAIFKWVILKEVARQMGIGPTEVPADVQFFMAQYYDSLARLVDTDGETFGPHDPRLNTAALELYSLNF